jgi:hypothetical protein
MQFDPLPPPDDELPPPDAELADADFLDAVQWPHEPPSRRLKAK